MLIVFWLICPIIAAACAPGRGRGGGSWFLICLLTGIFGLAALFLMDPVKPAPVGVAADPGPERACPHCAETIKAAAKVCRYCNRDVPPAEGYGPIPIYKGSGAPVVGTMPGETGF